MADTAESYWRMNLGECRGVLLRKDWGIGDVPQILTLPQDWGTQGVEKLGSIRSP